MKNSKKSEVNTITQNDSNTNNTEISIIEKIENTEILESKFQFISDSNIYNLDNVNIQNFNKRLISIIDVLKILVNFTQSHISDLIFTIQNFTNNLVEFKIISECTDNNLKENLLKVKNIKLNSFELTDLKKSQTEFIEKFKSSNNVNYENNLVVINTNEYLKNSSNKNRIDKYVNNCVNFYSKYLFNCYCEKDSKKTNDSLKFNSLFTFDNFSYDLIRNIQLFENLRNIMFLSLTNDSDREQFMKYSIIDFNNEILQNKVFCNNVKERNNCISLFKSHIETLSKEYIKETFEQSILTHVENLIQKHLHVKNVTELMKKLHK